jgi:hypothetical protein
MTHLHRGIRLDLEGLLLEGFDGEEHGGCGVGWVGCGGEAAGCGQMG